LVCPNGLPYPLFSNPKFLPKYFQIAHSGAAFALLGAMPMVMITGQKGILSRKQGRFQDPVATELKRFSFRSTAQEMCPIGNPKRVAV
jgi:hypothetical protein